MSEPLGTPKLITLHWTAGNHTMTFPEYHWCIRGDGSRIQTLPMAEKGAHCWRRNSGNIGVSMCAMADGYPVTAAQREATAVLCAELAGVYGLDLSATILLPELHLIGDQLQPTGRRRSFQVLADHAAFARADGYYPDRWDIGDEYPLIVARARGARAEIKAGKRPNTLVGQVR
jgi:hypothetical protein